MKIAIFTIHNCHNYGAMLQAYATQQAISKIGFDSEIVNLYPIDEEKADFLKTNSKGLKAMIKNCLVRFFMPAARTKMRRFADFHRRHLHLSKRYYSAEEMMKDCLCYDVYMVGSDQTWNIENGFPVQPIFFLDFIDKYKISYAASFGTDIIQDKYKARLYYYLSKFRALSVREFDGVRILNGIGLKAQKVMDPTFLVDRTKWNELAGDTQLIRGEYIFAYGFGDVVETNELIRQAKNKFNLPVIGASVSYFNPFDFDRYYQSAGPLEYLNLVKFSSFVITASYHGAAFAIHFRKSFYVTKHPTRNSRMASMLDALDLSDRCIEPMKKVHDFSSIDYGRIENKIKAETEKSFFWLENQLKDIEKDCRAEKGLI